jgi:hypothetical protein
MVDLPTASGVFVPQELYSELVEDRHRLDALLDPKGPFVVAKLSRGHPSHPIHICAAIDESHGPFCTRAEIDEVLEEEPDDGR